MIMLYWGLRSPWWLLWGDTLYDRGYLIEAAAPSGARAWNLRSSVASSQDIGHQVTWGELPAALVDSLGVWISNTAWASWQEDLDWADAAILDAARGGRLIQLWGELDLLLDSADDVSFADVLAKVAAIDRMTDRPGRPVLVPAWVDGAYGYLWGEDGEFVAVISNPGGEVARYTLAVPDAGSVRIGYCTRGLDTYVSLADNSLSVVQAPGSVAVLHTSPQAGLRQAGQLSRPAVVSGWVRLQSSSEPVDEANKAVKAVMTDGLLGRGPQIQPWITGQAYGELPIATMTAKLPARDRRLHRVCERWRGRVELLEPGQIAAVVRLTQGGRAWHNDRVNQLVRLHVTIDGQASRARALPYRNHEQAGSWTWMISRHDAGPGVYEVEPKVESVVPVTVELESVLWARTVHAEANRMDTFTPAAESVPVPTG